MAAQKFIFRYALALSICWSMLIFVLCAMPGQYIPSADWLELLSFDKFVHASLFFVLTGLWLLVAIRSRKKKGVYILCFAGALAYGILLEWMQANCFSNRSADWKDMIANGFGCTLALVFLKRIRKFMGISDQGS